MKKIAKKYKGVYKIGLNKQNIHFQQLKLTSLFVLPSPRQFLTQQELNSLKKLIETGGNLLVLANEGGDFKNNSNLNSLLQNFGIQLNNDLVIRASYYKYLHPRQAYITNGILSQQITRVIHGYTQQSNDKNKFLNNGYNDQDDFEKEANRSGVDFVYVGGCTLNVKHPAQSILSSGPLSYPSNRPIGAISNHKSGGRIMVLGSIEMFMDEFFQRQENAKIFVQYNDQDFILKYFTTSQVKIIHSEQPQQSSDYSTVPDIGQLADHLKSCFQQSQELPKDISTLFNQDLFKYDTNLIPEAVELYQRLGVKREALTLIVPQFQTPLLGLSPAVFPPILKQLPNPPLEQFDLDDEFSQQKVRLAQLTNNCENKDLEYFVREAGDILGISDKIRNRNQPKQIIKYILQQVINFKKTNPI